MEAPNQYTEQIDDFLTGRLGGTARADFESQLQSDPRLQQAVETQQLLMSGIDEFGNDQLRVRLQQISRERKQAPARARRLLLRRLVAAAAVMLLLLAVGWWWQSAPLTSDQHYATYFKPYSLSFSSRSNDVDLSLAQFEKHYRNQEYNQLITKVDAFLQKHPDNYPLQLATGISYLELERYQESLAYFDTIIAAEDPFYFDQARWYKALAYLKLDQQAESKAILEVLAKDAENDRQQAAIELLDALNQ